VGSVPYSRGITEEIVREYIAACNGDDIDRVLAVLHPSVELHEADTLPGAVNAVGFDSVSHYLERFGAHWSSFNWEVLDLVVAGERALMHARLRLEGRSSGIAVDREWFYVFTVRDSKILRQDGFDDRAAAEAALAART
jgi:ketosteroid isomerase-like protein